MGRGGDWGNFPFNFYDLHSRTNGQVSQKLIKKKSLTPKSPQLFIPLSIFPIFFFNFPPFFFLNKKEKKILIFYVLFFLFKLIKC
jgi:hypothetical protein